MKISDIEANFNILIYGNPGIGKTYLAGTTALVPEACPVLWCDTEKGAQTLKSAFAKEHDDKFIYERIFDYVELSNIYKRLINGDGETYIHTDESEHPWPQSIVVDNISEVQKMMMNRIMRIVVKEDSSRDIEVPSRREWGKLLEQMRTFIRAFRDLEMNTIFTAWEFEESERGKTITYPGLQGQMGGIVAGYIDIVGQMYAKNDGPDKSMRRRLLLETKNGIIAKGRGDLPHTLLEPTMEEILRLASA